MKFETINGRRFYRGAFMKISKEDLRIALGLPDDIHIDSVGVLENENEVFVRLSGERIPLTEEAHTMPECKS